MKKSTKKSSKSSFYVISSDDFLIKPILALQSQNLTRVFYCVFNRFNEKHVLFFDIDENVILDRSTLLLIAKNQFDENTLIYISQIFAYLKSLKKESNFS